MSMGLTAGQTRCLAELRRHFAAHGTAPTLQELATAMGQKGKSHIHAYLVALEERGRIRRIPNRARAIELVEGASEQSLALMEERIRSAVFAAVGSRLYWSAQDHPECVRIAAAVLRAIPSGWTMP